MRDYFALSPFPPDLQTIITPKPQELESWNFEKMITTHQVSGVRCQVSGVTCYVYFFLFSLESGWPSRWRGWYQLGLPRLVNRPGVAFTPEPYMLETWNFERIFTSLHMSHVMCHMSHFKCHMSHITGHMTFFLFIYLFFYKVVKLVDGGSVINRA